jgi:hypothetical protein
MYLDIVYLGGYLGSEKGNRLVPCRRGMMSEDQL